MQHRFLTVLVAVLLAGPGLTGCGASPGAGSTAGPSAAGSSAAGSSAAGPSAAAVPAATAPESASQPELPEVVARVNGTAILRAELERAVRSAEIQAGQVVPASLRGAVYERVLDRLIVFHLLLQESETRELAVDEADVDAEIDRIRDGFPSVEAFEARLVDWGTTLEELRTERRRDMLIATLIDADVTPRVAVGDEAARAFYDQHPDQFAEAEALQASHILIESAPDADPADRDAARGQAETIRRQALAAGSDFASLAREHSDDGATAPGGGDLGFVPRGQTVPSFEEALFALDPGQISEVTESQFGFHVIRAGDRREARVIPFEEAGGGIRRMLVAQARQALTGEFIARLRADGEIETYL